DPSTQPSENRPARVHSLDVPYASASIGRTQSKGEVSADEPAVDLYAAIRFGRQILVLVLLPQGPQRGTDPDLHDTPTCCELGERPEANQPRFILPDEPQIRERGIHALRRRRYRRLSR